MKGDMKRGIENGIDNVQKKVKDGVERLKSSKDQDDQPISKRIAPNTQSGEPNPQSKRVPKYCPYCGESLKGLFSKGDAETSQPPDDDEENENDQDERAEDNEEGGVSQGENEDDKNEEGSEFPARSNKSMQKDTPQQSRGKQEAQSERKFCPYCASPTTGSAYCPNCGNKIRVNKMEENDKKKINEKILEDIQKGEDSESDNLLNDHKVEGKASERDLKKIQNSR